MIKKLILRSNGQLLGYDDKDEQLFSVDLLEPAITKLSSDNQIDDNTDIYIPLSAEPIKLSKWYELIPLKPEIIADEVDKIVK